MDNNVTRHVPDELTRSDWNTMVLHYLGLDHIGHKAGPRRYDPQITSYLSSTNAVQVQIWSPNSVKWMAL